MITGIELKNKANSDHNGLIKYSNDESWQKQMVDAIRDPFVLLSLLELDAETYCEKLHFPENFKLLIPHAFIEKIKKGDWNDPLLKQIIPTLDETQVTQGFNTDPVGDINAIVANGVLQKYQGRVLLLTTGACAIHCRYCFRRHFSYADSSPDKKNWKSTIRQIEQDKTIHEVIFSGGDPLMLSDQRLRAMCEDIIAIPHVKTLRFHTRLPIILPQRINANFIHWLSGLNIQKVMVVHANHANEIDSETGAALQTLVSRGITVLNQSVLLHGVNDDVESLYQLSQRLFEYQVLPYYLHSLDKVQGAAHFEVSERVAIELIKSLKNRLPGYLVPKLVKEVSGERSKQALE